MLHKGSFKPKDARVMSVYEDGDDDDEMDDWSLTSTLDMTPGSRRKQTGTQALAEFLSTTSPEEFQKTNPPKRSSNLFFRRRKTKPPSSTHHQLPPPSPTYKTFAPNTVHRNNHIEIVPAESYPSTTSLSRIASRRPSRTSLLSRANDTQEKQQQLPQQSGGGGGGGGVPVLPSNRSINRRESSIFNEPTRHSIRSQVSINNISSSVGGSTIRARSLMQHDNGTTLSFGRRLSTHTFGGVSCHPQDEDYGHPLSNHNNNNNNNSNTIMPHEHSDRQAIESLVEHLTVNEEQDVIEQALTQRLKRFELAKMNKPSDTIATGLVTEHIKALEASAETESDRQQQTTKRKARHIQVQTMPIPSFPSPLAELSSSSSSSSSPPYDQEPAHDNEDDLTQVVTADNELSLIEQLQLQLAEERNQRKELQAALDETCDHFEALSGLAYKKLRELWEERNHWENTCIGLRDMLLRNMAPQQPIQEDAMSILVDSTYGVEK